MIYRLEGNKEENFCNPGLSRDFLGTLQKEQSIKEKKRLINWIMALFRK